MQSRAVVCTATTWTRLAGDVREFTPSAAASSGGQLDDEASATLEWNPHDDSSSLFGCFEGDRPPRSGASWPPSSAPSRSALHCSAPRLTVRPRQQSARLVPSIVPYGCGNRESESHLGGVFSRPSHLHRNPAISHVIIDHSGSLHERISRGRTHKLEPAPLEFLSHGSRLGSDRGNLCN